MRQTKVSVHEHKQNLKLLLGLMLQQKLFNCSNFIVIFCLGAISYIVVVLNTETNAQREIPSPISQVQVTSLESGTFYELHVLSVGEQLTNTEGSQTVRRQTGKKLVNFKMTRGRLEFFWGRDLEQKKFRVGYVINKMVRN